MKIPKLSLTQWIFVGWFTPEVAVSLRPLSTIFLRLIKSIIAPLIFATLVVGIAGHGNLKQVGRMGVKALIYFEVVTTAALVVGLIAVNLVRPGIGVNIHTAVQTGVADCCVCRVVQLCVGPCAEGKASGDSDIL